MIRLITVLLTFQMAYAEEKCPNAVRLKQGDVVVGCDRIGLSTEYDLQVRKDLVEADLNKKIIEQQKLIIQAEDESQIRLKAESEKDRESYVAERNAAGRNLWIGLGAGILTTILIGLVVKPVVK